MLLDQIRQVENRAHVYQLAEIRLGRDQIGNLPGCGHDRYLLHGVPYGKFGIQNNARFLRNDLSNSVMHVIPVGTRILGKIGQLNGTRAAAARILPLIRISSIRRIVAGAAHELAKQEKHRQQRS
ncbi:hypothetical protein J1TS5_47330 [Paenibacillus macerans]|nr:hypothetical protein J1TS5_47330 [Paenibacillus macerans]